MGTATELLLGSSTNVTSLAVVVISLGLLIWSSTLFRSCGSKDDRENDQNIKERVDGFSYRTTIVPLFEYVNKSVADQIRSQALALPTELERNNLINEYERLKSETFSGTDFSSIKDTIVEIPQVMQAIERTLKFKRISQRYYQLSSWLLGVSIILFLLAIALVFLYSNNFQTTHVLIMNLLVGIWVLGLVAWGVLCFWFHMTERMKNSLALI